MKRLILLILLLTGFQGFSQTRGISYQAVILSPSDQELPGQDASGNILANTAVSIQFTIVNASAGEEFKEYHRTSTDEFGLINLLIGTGTSTGSSNFTDIVWDGTIKKLKVGIDFSGGTNFSPLSEQNLTYMPQPINEQTAQVIAGIIVDQAILKQEISEIELVPGEKGEAGSQGIQGTKGDTGAQGIQGEVGPQGLKGDKGDTGTQGIQGEQGLKGDTGAQGIQGEQGLKGDTGTQGIQGEQGLKGDTGTQGIQGEQGLKGDTGAQGIQGEQGLKGDTGTQGIQGEQGLKGDTGTQGIQGEVGPQGPAGNDGAVGAQGATGAAGLTTSVNSVSQVNGNVTLTTSDVREGNNKYYTEAAVSANADVTANTAKVGYTDALVAANSAVAANTLKKGITDGTTAGQMLYWNGTAWISVAAGSNGQVLIFAGGNPTWSTYSTASALPSNTVISAATGKVWMDRNLGASQVATSSTDAYGDLYQWGRAADGHQIRISSTTTVQSSSTSPGINFITGSDNWYTGTNPDNLWQGVNGINNPCPSGYRLPTETEWEAERRTWSSNDAVGAFVSQLKLPLTGGRSDSNGSVSLFGIIGTYWSSTVSSSTGSRNLGFNSSDARMSTNFRALGSAVRCLKD